MQGNKASWADTLPAPITIYNQSHYSTRVANSDLVKANLGYER